MIGSIPPEKWLEAARDVIVRKKWAAHIALFPHRHPVPGAIFHEALVDEFWNDEQYAQVMAFRGGAKSTIGEEDIVIATLLRIYHNILIIGASERRAAERLAAITYELKTNYAIEQVFGQVIIADTQTKITTAHGCVQAMGRDQDIRGIKHLDFRPDFVFVDDFEDKDSVQTPEGRNKTLNWFLAELLPACVPQRRVRVRATPMDAESVPMRLQNEAKWPTRIYPVEIINAAGERQATWPSLFPLEWVDREKRTYIRLGKMDVWNREFMCQAVSDSDRTFNKEMMRVRPRVRTWEATYAMLDPARTTNRLSATTGWVVWSWVSGRLVVWKSGAVRYNPSEIISLIFEIHDKFGPIWIGFEEDGLNEWALQPIRQEMLKRGIYLPLKPMRAPRGKFDFIRGLQPFFNAGEVEFAGPQPELEEQLLNFPTGEIDAPNALAYAVPMRPASPIYDNFSLAHVADTVMADRNRPFWLACNATKAMVTAVLLQYGGGRLRILDDFVSEGDPAAVVQQIVKDASMIARARVHATCGPQHYDQYLNVGLVQALGRIPVEVERGSDPARGRDALRDEFSNMTHAIPNVQVARTAHHTLNALAGGYSRYVTRQGVLMQEAEPGLYRLLMEGLESCLGYTLAEDDADNDQNYAYTAAGVRYRRYSTGYDRRQ
jgi:hypothetical protein